MKYKLYLVINNNYPSRKQIIEKKMSSISSCELLAKSQIERFHMSMLGNDSFYQIFKSFNDGDFAILVRYKSICHDRTKYLNLMPCR